MFSFLRSLLLALILAVVVAGSPAQAQTYDSGSTGANGAFPPATAPAGTTYIVMNLGTGGLTFYNASNASLGTASVGSPNAQGVYNFTTFYLATGITLYFTPDSLNRPVRFLASGDMTISGTIEASGTGGALTSNSLPGRGGAGGPGGFRGGDSGYWTGTAYTVGAPGAGPAGGQGAINSGDFGKGGSLVRANSQLVPFWGGSGGGGGGGGICNIGNTATGGSGGGGAVLLASSGTITLNGSIRALGGTSPPAGSGCSTSAFGGGGSGGAVRVVAATITGSGSISVAPGGGVEGGGPGFVRTEAFNNGIPPERVTGSPTYIRSLTPLTAIPTGQPSITVTSIGGLSAPAGGNGGNVTPTDISFSTTQTSPVTLNVASVNVPLNTSFTVRIAPVDANQTSAGNVVTATGTINAGSYSAGTGSVQVTLPRGTSLINVYASFTSP
ncbi:hypothetical protein [Anthocerotibacter panamensis]|uniref:hypothetical protein n=1 Tax=Anthocerotibacter panamensis TaxID=2857077 RepID=UPI001C401899|nr:hypothetical protein [Anthocerotibacter panamensis]